MVCINPRSTALKKSIAIIQFAKVLLRTYFSKTICEEPIRTFNSAMDPGLSNKYSRRFSIRFMK